MIQDRLETMSRIVLERHGHRHDFRRRVMARPMFGGPFGPAGYEIGSYLTTRGGLHSVVYFVMHLESGAVLSMEDTKAAALASARHMLADPETVGLIEAFREITAQANAHHQRAQEALQAQSDACLAAQLAIPRPKSIPKRRRDVFEKSGGKCHYCAIPLTLDGRWHIEHKMPRALLGGNEMDNLVASCVPCNMQKRDKTDLEFIAQREGTTA